MFKPFSASQTLENKVNILVENSLKRASNILRKVFIHSTVIIRYEKHFLMIHHNKNPRP